MPHNWLRKGGKRAAEGLVMRNPEHWDAAIDHAMQESQAPSGAEADATVVLNMGL